MYGGYLEIGGKLIIIWTKKCFLSAKAVVDLSGYNTLQISTYK